MARDKVKRNVVDLCSVPQGTAGPAIEGTHARPGLRHPRRRRRDADARLRRRLAADRGKDGGAAGPALGGRRPAWAGPIPRPCRRRWPSGVRSGPQGTPRLGAHAGPSRCPRGVSTSCPSTDDCRPGFARRPAPSGSTSVSSSPRAGARRSTPPTSAGTSAPPSAGPPGIDADAWTPRELRHSFVSLLSDSGVPIEEISRLVGHKSTLVTEVVYRKQLRPVIQSGATVMDQLFASVATKVATRTPSDTGEPGSLAEGTGL